VWALLLLLGIPAYFYAGLHIGDKALNSWDNEDNDSLAAKMLFPFNAYRGSVGEVDFSTIEVLREECPDDSAYRILMAIFWPLKLAWNIPGMMMFGGPGLVKQAVAALAERRGGQPQDYLPSAGDDIPRLYGKVRAIDEEVRDLLLKREIVIDEIDHQRTELTIVVETEEELLDQPEIPPQLTDGSEREEK